MNVLETTLDEALKVALESKATGTDYNVNIMVTGNPTSDNQLFIQEWAKQNNITLVRADSDILHDGSHYKTENGILVKQPDKMPSLLPFLSTKLRKINPDKNYIVLFHRYNMQDDVHYRESILPLVTDHLMHKDGLCEGPLVEQPNLLFCIASVVQPNWGQVFEYSKKEDVAYPIKIEYSHMK